MKSKFASKTANVLPFYLNERGRYDINKSEERRATLKTNVTISLSKFDLLRNRDMHERSAITRLINTIFGA